MRAVRAVDIDKVALVEVEDDARPLGSTEVAGRTVATLVSPGTELAVIAQAGGFPKGLGYAAVFEVEAGRLGFVYGPHASRQRAERSAVHPVPDGLAAEVAVFARLMAVSMSTLVTTTARPPDKIVVTGLGPVGNLAAQVFQASGYEVLAVDPVAERRAGAERVDLATAAAIPLGDPAWQDKAALVVECSGHEAAVLDACKLVRKRGEVVLVGVPWKRRTDLQSHDLLHAIFHRYVVVRGGWEWELPHQPADFRVGSLHANAAAALRWLADGRVKVDGLGERADPADADAVYAALRRGEGAPTRVFCW